MAKRLWDKGEGGDAGETNEEILRFTTGEDPELDLRLVTWDAIASAAHARMLCSIGILKETELRSLLAALNEVIISHRQATFEIPRELEDCHTAIEAFLVEKCGDSGKRIHTGRSRNDQVLTAMRLYLRFSLNYQLIYLENLIESLLTRASAERNTVMPGYTHLQAAMPSSVGLWMHAFAEALTKEHHRGLDLIEQVNTNPLGAAAGFGVPIPLDRQMTADLLGFTMVQWNPIEAQNSRGRYELLVSRFFSDIASHLEKLAWDFSLYTTREFGFITLPKEITTGSSIMPQKRNPDVAELIRARAARIRGRVSELEWVIAKLPSNYHRDFQYTKGPLFTVEDDTSAILHAMKIVIDGFKLNPDRLQSAMTPEVYATYDAFVQVREGIPFRDAYRTTAKRLENNQLALPSLEKEFAQVISGLGLWIEATSERLRLQKEKRLEWENSFDRAEDAVLSED